MATVEKRFGRLPDGREAFLYTLENNNGMRAEISDLGGILYRLFVPDKNGRQDDVVLGHRDFDAYLQNKPYFGALVGRNSNRIGGAKLMIAGKTCTLEQNESAANLHSGSDGLSFRLMQADQAGLSSLKLTVTMESLSDGFPGNLDITVFYALTDENALEISYYAIADEDTVINLTNHSYFNLGGHASGPVYNHILQLDAPFYAPATAACLPTGEIRDVTDTPFDFHAPRPLGEDINGSSRQLHQFGGYDHNLILDGESYRDVGSVTEPVSGRMMRLYTSLNNVQLYTANAVQNGTPGKDGALYGKHSGFCLETQFFPNAPHMPWLRSPIYRAGEAFNEKTAYRFTVL